MSSATQKASRAAYQKIEPYISKTKEEILQGILDYFKEKGHYPRYRVLAKYIEKDRISVSSRLGELVDDGYVMRIETRSISRGAVALLTPKGHAKLKEVSNV